MVEISVEILASSVPMGRENIRYKVKTWWAHVDFEDGNNLVKLPGLPMIEHYYNMTGKDTTIFVEMWYRNDDVFPPPGNTKFLGMAKCQVDEQLKDSRRNPSVVWLEMYDPIEDIVRGRILLKVDAKFTTASIPAPELFPVPIDLTAKGPASSSYFINQNQNHAGCPANMNLFSSPSTGDCDSSPSKRSITIQTDTSEVGSPMSVVSNIPCGQEDLEDDADPSKEPTVPPSIAKLCLKSTNSNDSRFHQEIVKANKEKVNQKKKVEDKGSPFNVRVGGKTYTIQVDSSGPKVISTKSVKKVITPNSHPPHDKTKRSSFATTLSSGLRFPSKTATAEVVRTNKNDSVEDVIDLLNDHFDELLLGNAGTNEKHGTKAPEKIRKVTSTLSKLTNSASNGSVTTINPEILRLRRLQMDRVISESEISDPSSSPQKFPGQEQNELETTDASDFSPFGPSGMNLGVLGLGFKEPGQMVRLDSRNDPQMQTESALKSKPDPVMKITRVEDPTCNVNGGFKLPRSRREAAAIFNY